jgi:hypothetical protein
LFAGFIAASVAAKQRKLGGRSASSIAAPAHS